MKIYLRCIKTFTQNLACSQCIPLQAHQDLYVHFCYELSSICVSVYAFCCRLSSIYKHCYKIASVFIYILLQALQKLYASCLVSVYIRILLQALQYLYAFCYKLSSLYMHSVTSFPISVCIYIYIYAFCCKSSVSKYAFWYKVFCSINIFCLRIRVSSETIS